MYKKIISINISNILVLLFWVAISWATIKYRVVGPVVISIIFILYAGVQRAKYIKLLKTSKSIIDKLHEEKISLEITQNVYKDINDAYEKIEAINKVKKNA